MDREVIENLQAVVFDMDGLMFDSERYVQKSWDRAGIILGYGPLGYHITNTLGTNRINRERYFKKQYGPDFPFERFLDVYRDAYWEMLEGKGVPAKKGLHELLEVLKKHHIKMGVATSSSAEHAWGNLEREGISHYFQTVITGDMIKHGKPEPDIYMEACQKLCVKPEDSIALEDAINGIWAAHRAGMLPVMIPDIVKDTSEVNGILFGVYESLLDFSKVLDKNLRGK